MSLPAIPRTTQSGGSTARFLELTGSKIIEPTAFEPDPNTHREEYYYNTIMNALYKKIITRKKPIHAYWQRISPNK